MRKERAAEPSLTGLDGLATRTIAAPNLRMARARPVYTRPLQTWSHIVTCVMQSPCRHRARSSSRSWNHREGVTLVTRTSPQVIFSMSAESQPKWSQ